MFTVLKRLKFVATDMVVHLCWFYPGIGLQSGLIGTVGKLLRLDTDGVMGFSRLAPFAWVTRKVSVSVNLHTGLIGI